VNELLCGDRGGLDHSYLPIRPRQQWDDKIEILFAALTGFRTEEFFENYYRLSFPLVLSPATYFKLCWRVKKFQLTGTITTDEGSRDFDTEVAMVRLPVEGDPQVDDETFQTMAAASEMEIIRSSDRIYLKDPLVLRRPYMDPPPAEPPVKSSDVPRPWRDLFFNQLRNAGFYMRQYEDSPVNFSLAKPFPEGGGLPFCNVDFNLLSDEGRYADVFFPAYPEFIGAIYDEDTKMVHAPLFFSVVLGAQTCRSTQEPVAGDPLTDYPGGNIAAGELSIEGLQDDPIIVPMYRGDIGFGTASVTATLTAAEFWPYQNSQGLPIYDTITGEQLRDPLT
jgi:hypothetical protein